MRCLVRENLHSWDAHLSQAEFAHNLVVNRSTGLCPFQIVYDVVPRGPTDLFTLPSPARVDASAADMIETLRHTHQFTKQKLLDSNANYKQIVDRMRRLVDFEVGDFVWAILMKDRYLAHEYSKLAARKIGLVEIIEKMGLNAYRLKLPSHIRTSDIFNIKHLIPFHGDNDDDSDDSPLSTSRSKSFPAGENDADATSLAFMEAYDRVFRPKLC